MLKIFCSVSGGVLKTIMIDPPQEVEVFVVDYDNSESETEEDFEKSVLDGKTWDEATANAKGVL